MIPFFSWTTIHFGPLTIYVWGLLVALGAIVGVSLSSRTARRLGLPSDLVSNASVWMIAIGFLGARIGHAAFYEPVTFLADPLEFFRVWHGGFSSMGGFLGALAAFAFFLHRHRATVSAWVLTDCLATGFPLGWAVGRIGCFLIHDHPGTLSHSFLAVRFPGGSRFDLGLIDSLTAFFVEGVLLFVLWRYPKRGIPTIAVITTYLFIRFWTDFLRASDLPGSDVRVFGLFTPAQIGCLVLLDLVIFLGIRSWRRGTIGKESFYGNDHSKNSRVA